MGLADRLPYTCPALWIILLQGEMVPGIGNRFPLSNIAMQRKDTRLKISFRFALMIALLCAMVPAILAADPVVQVTGGQIQGRPIPEGGAVFKGVPFAQPPVGELRWREPAPVKPWTGIRDAGVFGAACTQQVVEWNKQEAQGNREDCLYLNVWTPEWPKFEPQQRPYLEFTDNGPVVRQSLRPEICNLYIEALKETMPSR